MSGYIPKCKSLFFYELLFIIWGSRSLLPSDEEIFLNIQCLFGFKLHTNDIMSEIVEATSYIF